MWDRKEQPELVEQRKLPVQKAVAVQATKPVLLLETIEPRAVKRILRLVTVWFDVHCYPLVPGTFVNNPSPVLNARAISRAAAPLATSISPS